MHVCTEEVSAHIFAVGLIFHTAHVPHPLLKLYLPNPSYLSPEPLHQRSLFGLVPLLIYPPPSPLSLLSLHSPPPSLPPT